MEKEDEEKKDLSDEEEEPVEEELSHAELARDTNFTWDEDLVVDL
jgi:hypothetical protein